MGKCHFQIGWLNKQDCNGYFVSQWAIKSGENDFLCIVCSKTVSIQKGFYSIQQHAEGTKHKQNCVDKLQSNKISLCSSSGEPSGTIKIYNVQDSARAAELTWALKVVSSNYAASSCSDCSDIFRKMFPTPGAVPEGFSLSPTKLSYILTDALGPYFYDEMLSEARSSVYALQYDETTNNAGKKELQVRIRFWSEKCNRIISHHLETFFMAYAKAEDLKENILKALHNANLPLSSLVSVSSDGPNVNKKVFRLLNEEVLSTRNKGLVDIGTCTIHTVHNSFLKGVEELGSDASDLIISLYNYFNDWPTRWEDYTNIQEKVGVPAHRFIKHVTSRWLTLETAANRLLEQWPAVHEYFLKYIPSKKEPRQMNSVCYKRIVEYLKSNTMKCEILFIVSSAYMFTKFTSFFQREEPLIHLVHKEVKDLLVRIAGRICKKDAVKAFSSNVTQDLFEKSNLVLATEVVIDEDLRKEVLKLSEKERALFMIDVQKHYLAAGSYLLGKDILGNKTLRYLRCVNPRVKNSKLGYEGDVSKLGSILPVNIRTDVLIDEWKVFLLDADEPQENRVDTFWAHFLKKKIDGGELKYPSLAKFIKAALCLYHGSADVERGFSLSGEILSEKRSHMKERMLNARLNVADGLKMYYNNEPVSVPITKKLISLAIIAYKGYQGHIENEKRLREEKQKKADEVESLKAAENAKRKEAEEEKKKVCILEDKLKKVKKDVGEQDTFALKLLDEGNVRLKKALAKGDIMGAKLAQTMIDAGISSNLERKEKEKEVFCLVEKVGKRKDTIITSFFQKKPKT